MGSTAGGGDGVLHDVDQTAGDEWLAPFLSSASTEAVAAELQLIGRYPSIDDWNMLDRIKAGAGADSNPSLWIMDSTGTTREFKYSERDYFKGLLNEDDKMKRGEGLEGRTRSESCN